MRRLEALWMQRWRPSSGNALGQTARELSLVFGQRSSLSPLLLDKDCGQD
jgi:hypothetical protein